LVVKIQELQKLYDKTCVNNALDQWIHCLENKKAPFFGAIITFIQKLGLFLFFGIYAINKIHNLRISGAIVQLFRLYIIASDGPLKRVFRSPARRNKGQAGGATGGFRLIHDLHLSNLIPRFGTGGLVVF
jgi:hypothetical protein